MFLIDENQLGFGIPIDFNGICWIYPLTIREILNISQEQFQKYLSLLTITKDDINKITNNEFDGSVFKYLLFQSYYSDTFLMDLKKAFSTFIKEEITFSFETEEIIIGKDFKEKRVIKEDNFEDFQNIIRRQNCLKEVKPIPKNENPMQKKFRIARERREAAKARTLEANGEKITFFESVENLICYNIGYNFSNILDLTYFQFNTLLEKATNKYNYEMDMQMIAAGADPKKIKPKIWLTKEK